MGLRKVHGVKGLTAISSRGGGTSVRAFSALVLPFVNQPPMNTCIFGSDNVFVSPPKLQDSEERMLDKWCICSIVTRCLNIERKMEQKKGAQRGP